LEALLTLDGSGVLCQGNWNSLRCPMLRRLFNYARLSPKLAIWLLLLSIIDSLWAPVFPKVTAYIQNEVIPAKDYAKLWWAIGAVVGVGILRDILSFFRTRTSGKFGQMITFNIRSALYNKLQRLPVKWFDNQRTGDIMTRVADDVPAMERVLNEGLETLVRLVFQVLVVAATLFHTDVPLTLVAMIPIPFLILGGLASTKAAQRVYRVGREASSSLNSLVNDNISGIRQIKAYHLLDQELGRFNEASNHMREANLKINFFWALSSPLIGSVVALGYTAVLAYGAHRCFQGHLKAGDLSVYLLLLWAFYDPIQRLKDLHQLLQSAQTASERVFSILDLPDEVDIDDGEKMAAMQGHVEFKNVTFSYADRPTLKGVSLEAKPGETIALAGSSGAGKSTILYLLARFYEYDGGSVLVDGQELNQLSKDTLRRSLGYVTQEAFLFNGTIRENLKIARANATDEEIWQALRSANAEGFIKRQPEGLDTAVGERGVRLSGGEKQRISIARVLLKNPAILLLDEATASVDNETERLIQEALDRLMKGRTAFVIAHRLSTIRNADRIYVMDQGQVVESGRHDDLVNAGGLYEKLCQTSFREDDAPNVASPSQDAEVAAVDERLPFQPLYQTPPGEIPPRM
jgi:ATP-binding cassette, subfamily B, bacterial